MKKMAVRTRTHTVHAHTHTIVFIVLLEHSSTETLFCGKTGVSGPGVHHAHPHPEWSSQAGLKDFLNSPGLCVCQPLLVRD